MHDSLLQQACLKMLGVYGASLTAAILRQKCALVSRHSRLHAKAMMAGHGRQATSGLKSGG